MCAVARYIGFAPSDQDQSNSHEDHLPDSSYFAKVAPVVWAKTLSLPLRNTIPGSTYWMRMRRRNCSP